VSSRDQLELPLWAVAEVARRLGAHAGLRPPGWALEARIRERIRDRGAPALEAYLAGLDGAELDALVDSLRVGETRFFRHRAHVGALRRVVAPDLAARGAAARRVRAWSAGCASGEEAYSLAMLLADAMPAAGGWDVEVLGTDISDEPLAVARAGRYPRAALDPVPARLRDRFFAVEGEAVLARPELRALVRFERRNLVDMPYPARRDLILCRNVLIYFDAETRAETVNRLIGALVPGGYLFLGYAESLRQFDALEALRTEDGVVYRRPDRPRRSPPAPARRDEPELALALAPAPASAPAGPRAAAQVPDPTATCTVHVEGEHLDAETVALDLRRAIAGANRRIVVNLDGASFIVDEIAPVLRRAAAAAQAAGIAFQLVATRPGPRRWLARHDLGGAEDDR
jgi:chemotaxis protein methyltransferase CheR